jgi:hypothetical protein
LSVPLSEHEQRVLQELEQALYRQDPAFADRVRDETVYRHAGRYIRWSVVGFLVGFVLMVTLFVTNVAYGFIGFLVMFGSLVAFWANLRRMGKAGWHDLSNSLRSEGGVGSAMGGARARLRDRFRRDN